MLGFLKNVPVFLAAFLAVVVPAAAAQETPHFDFVSEFVSELGAMENLRAGAEQESKDANNNPSLIFMSGIYYSTQVKLELQARINKLSSMRLNPPFDALIGMLKDIYKQKIELHDALIDIYTQFMSGPKPTQDYGGMAAKMPQIRALLESQDQLILENITPMAFFTLLDKKPDANGLMSYLSITKKQRQQLLTKLSRTFGSKLDAKDQNFIVSSASVLRNGLLKKKCADER